MAKKENKKLAAYGIAAIPNQQFCTPQRNVCYEEAVL